jgi:hypothetical protein
MTTSRATRSRAQTAASKRSSRSTRVRKISISIDEATLRWAEKRATELGSVSAVLTEAARLMQREEERRSVLDYLGKAAVVSSAEEAEILRAWRGT